MRLSPNTGELIKVGAIDVNPSPGDDGGEIMLDMFIAIFERKRELLPPN